MKSYQELTVWQKAFYLAKRIYEITRNFPKDELYGIVSQMRRAAVSIVSNIAEGFTRGSTKEYMKFLRMALGSASELETQLLLSRELGYISEHDFIETKSLLLEILKMLNSLLVKLKPRTNH